jgi:hypothetical protein
MAAVMAAMAVVLMAAVGVGRHVLLPNFFNKFKILRRNQ